MRSLLVIAFLIGLAVAQVPSSTNVELDSGWIQGFVDVNNVRSFLGIPYAAPPVGDLRWAPPQPVVRWDDVRPALAFGNDCYQGQSIITNTKSEDCLYLNVWAPNTNDSTPIPVMFFIYGGSFTTGGTSFSVYDGSNIVKLHLSNSSLFPPVVVVTANYRLGPLGFLGSRYLAAEHGGITGTYGLLDQLAALRWIQRNIAKFGGDPTRVMSFGESAGAASVFCHLVMPSAAGLFSRAGMQSAPDGGMAISFSTADQTADAIIGAAGCTNAVDVLGCMRNKTVEEIYQAADSVSAWGPVVDGVSLPGMPEELTRVGNFSVKNIPILLGTNRDEATIFTIGYYPLSESAYRFVVNGYFRSAANEALRNYPIGDGDDEYPDAWHAFTAMISDSVFRCAARRFATWYSMHGMNGVYMYYFVHQIESLPNPLLGVFHSSELPFVFNTPNGPLSADVDGFSYVSMTDSERALAYDFVRLWTNFASVGNPNGNARLQAWPSYSLKMIYAIDETPPGMSNVSAYEWRAEQCDFWDSLADYTETISTGSPSDTTSTGHSQSNSSSSTSSFLSGIMILLPLAILGVLAVLAAVLITIYKLRKRRHASAGKDQKSVSMKVALSHTKLDDEHEGVHPTNDVLPQM